MLTFKVEHGDRLVHRMSSLELHEQLHCVADEVKEESALMEHQENAHSLQTQQKRAQSYFREESSPLALQALELSTGYLLDKNGEEQVC